MPREFQSVSATAMRNVSADVQEKYLTEIPRVRNMTDHIFISGKILRHLKRYAYIYIHTQCLVHSTQPNINGTRLSRERRDVRAQVGLSALLRTSTPGLPYGACIPCWSCILPGLVKPD